MSLRHVGLRGVDQPFGIVGEAFALGVLALRIAAGHDDIGKGLRMLAGRVQRDLAAARAGRRSESLFAALAVRLR